MPGGAGTDHSPSGCHATSWSNRAVADGSPAQDSDPILVRVGQWVNARKHPPCKDVSEVKAYITSPSGPVWLSVMGCSIGSGAQQALGRLWQLLLPKDLRQCVLQAFHGSVGAGLFGVAKTLNRLCQWFYWAGWRWDTELFIHCCDACTAQKGPARCLNAPLQQYQVGGPPWRRSGWTFWGRSLPLIPGIAMSLWPWTTLQSDLRRMLYPTRVQQQQLSGWCVKCSAVQKLHSDQGWNFEVLLFAEVCQRIGVKKTRMTLFHPSLTPYPQSDVLVERFNRTLTTQLAIVTLQHQHDRDHHLPMVL